MGWTDLFKSKSVKMAPDPRVRWFGKLPTYADYYRSQADQPWATEFHDWVLRGFELYRQRTASAGRAGHRLPVSGCMLRLPESGMTVLASILDYGGDMRGRPFPMCFYAGFPSALWPGPTSDRVTPAARAVGVLLGLRRDVGRFVNSPGPIEQTFSEREVDLSDLAEQRVDDSWIKAGKSVALDEWFAAARDGLKADDARHWLQLASAWGAALARHEGDDFEPTLCLPLAMRVSLEVQVAGWIRWIESRMNLKRRFVSLMVSGDLDGQVGRLTLIARALVPDDFLLLTPLAHTLSYVDDLAVAEAGSVPGLARPVDAAADERPASSPARDDAAAETGSWVDFVESTVPVA